MENKFNNIDEIFAKSLGDHGVDPPAYVWDNIKGQLDAASGKRRARIGWITGTASAIVVAFVGGYFIANSFAKKYSGNLTTEKISTHHQVQIDINRFWNNDQIFGETSNGGHTYSSFIPGVILNDHTDTSHDNNTHHNFGNQDNNGGDPGNFGTRTNHDRKKNNTQTQNPVKTNQDSHTIIDDDSDNNSSGDNNNQDKLNSNDGDINPNENENSNPNLLMDHSDNNSTHQINGDVDQINENENYTSASVENHSDDTNVDKNEVSDANVTPQTNDVKNLSNQDEKEEPKMVKCGADESPTTFTILPYFSPTYTFRNSRMSNTDALQAAFDTTGSFRGFNETTNFSYSTGLLVGYNFTPRLTVFIGAAYNTFSNTTHRNNVNTLSFNQIPAGESTPMVTSAGDLTELGVQPTLGTPENPTYIVQDYMIGNNQIGEVKRITQTFSYVEVPVLVRYRLFGPKIGMIFTGGLSTGFVVQNEVRAESDIDSRVFGGTSNIRNFSMNASIGVGLEAQILPFMYFNLEPTFKYSFINWSTSDNFSMNPISIGLNTGLAFKF